LSGTIENIQCAIFKTNSTTVYQQKTYELKKHSSIIKNQTVMKSLITITLSIWLLLGSYAQAQKDYDWTKAEVEQLTTLKEQIITEEKDALKREVENINARLESNAVTDAEAETLKQAAAEKHALNIENRVAIVDNQVALIKRNGIDST
jgi:DNA-binding helix-hairpin-helix protein with protein kinase domain